MIRVDVDKCIGCFCCSNICPNKNIICEEGEAHRTISFKKCGEECDLCVEFCPARALTLVPESEEISMNFELAACGVCGVHYATKLMLQRIEKSLPSDLQKDCMGLAWIKICPICRRKIEAERATKEMMLARIKTKH